MAANDHPRFTIVGAGLGGALIATYLGQAGHEVEVYERRPDPRGRNAVGGRSINLALSTRGIHALEEVGVATEIMKAAIPMRGRMIH
ncbi:MAG: NAD(P)-binding protein, partial [Planctomycetes bacterium]|nr:NAD(P)-binding protein [Planctomycetota bacterium]